MIIKKIILFYAVLFSFPVFSEAQASSDGSLTLEQCISIALKHNPLVLSALQERIAATERVTQTDVFPIPSIDFNSDDLKREHTLCIAISTNATGRSPHLTSRVYESLNRFSHSMAEPCHNPIRFRQAPLIFALTLNRNGGAIQD